MYCEKCGAPLEDGANFCQSCGASMQSSAVAAYDPKKQDECMKDLYNNLRRERTSWKIVGIISLVYGAVFSLGSLISAFVGLIALLDDEKMGLLILQMSLMYLFFGILIISVAVFNLVMAKRTRYYIDTLYTDCSLAVERCGNVGMIILSAFFNNVALIFTIINFTSVKSNLETFEHVSVLQNNANK